MAEPAVFQKTQRGVRVLVFRSLSQPLRKAEKKKGDYPPIPPGARWITLSPNGKDQDPKIPVLIQQKPGAGNTWVVVGGAGGQKMRGMQLHEVGTKEDWEQAAKERRKKKKAAEEERRKEMIEAGRGKELATEEMIRQQEKELRRATEREFIEMVAEAAGWEDWDLTQEEMAAIPKEARGLAEYRHHRAMLSRARETVKESQARYIGDADLRQQISTYMEMQAAGDWAGEPERMASEILEEVSRITPTTHPGYDRARKQRLVEQMEETRELTREQVQEWKKEAQETLEEVKDADPAEAALQGYTQSRIVSAMREADGLLEQAETLEEAGDEDRAAQLRRDAADLVAKREGELRALEGRQEKAAGDPETAYRMVAGAERMSEIAKTAAAEIAQRNIVGRAEELQTAFEQADKMAHVFRASQKFRAGMSEIRRKKSQLEKDLRDRGIDEVLPEIESEMIANPVQLSEMPDEEADAMWEKDLAERTATAAFEEFLQTALTGHEAEGVEGSFSVPAHTGWTQEQYERAIYPHVGGGAYGALSGALQTLTGHEVIDRDVIDVLGTERTAEMVAWWMNQNMSAEDFAIAKEALEQYHQSRVHETVESTLEEVREAMQVADELVLPEGETPEDLLLAKQQNDMRLAFVNDAIQSLGNAWGDMHVIGQLVGEMQKRHKAKKEVVVDMRGRSAGDIVGQARGLMGLSQSEYELKRVSGGYALHINEDGLRRLTSVRTPQRALEVAREMTAIKRGDRDEKGWLPRGWYSRPPSALDAAEGLGDPTVVYETPNLAGVSGEDMESQLTGYIGALAVASGGDPLAMRSFLRSSEMQSRLGASDSEEVRKALDRMLPIPDGRGGKEAIAQAEATCLETMQKAAAQFLKDSPLSDQRLPMEEREDQVKMYDALLQAVNANPVGRLAFSDPGELSGRERREVREAWRDMTGKGKEEWTKFLDEMGGEGPAYAAALEMVEGRMIDAFAGRYEAVTGRELERAQVEVGWGDGKKSFLGGMVDSQLRAALPHVTDAFQTGASHEMLTDLNMSGRFTTQQRMVKAIVEGRRVGLWAGAGSGKTGISIGAFTELHSRGEATKGLFVVPPGIISQFGGDIARFTEPGRYGFTANPDLSREERFKAYADPENHMTVTSYVTLRDDTTHALAGILAQEQGISRKKAFAQARHMLNSGTRSDRKAAMQRVYDEMGWNFNYIYVDEAHRVSNRKGKENSWMANVADAAVDMAGTAVLGSGTPVKNDPSELFDMLHKLDPERFNDQATFLRRYGGNTIAAKEALRQLTAPYFYSERIESGQDVHRHTEQVELSDWQRGQQQRVLDAFGRAQLSHRRGRVDVEAMRTLMGDKAFEGLSEKEAEEKARAMQPKAGAMRDVALRRLILDAPAEHNSKVQQAVEMASARVKRTIGEEAPAGFSPGNGVVFCGSLEGLRQLRKGMEREGLSVDTIQGADGSSERERKKVAFNEGDTNVLICTNAVAEGLNLQKGGRWLMHYDVPVTAMLHKQRSARIDRIGQTSAVEVINLVADSPFEQKAVRRLTGKGRLGNMVEEAIDFDEHNLGFHVQQVLKKRGQA